MQDLAHVLFSVNKTILLNEAGLYVCAEEKSGCDPAGFLQFLELSFPVRWFSLFV